MMDFFSNIKAYIEGTLTSDQQVLFEKEIEQNKELALAVEQYDETSLVLDYLVEKDIQKSINKAKSTSSISNKKPNKSYFRIAASVAFLAIASLFAYQALVNDNSINVMDYYQLPISQSSRSVTSTSDYLDAIASFDKRDFSTAESQFKSLLEQGVQISECNRYLGHINFINKEYSIAKTYFKTAIEINSDKNGTLMWNAMLCDIELGKTQEIIESIETLKNNSEFPYKDKLEILNKSFD